MKIKETEAAIEAILFAMGGSVELPRIARAIGVDEKTTGRIIRNMMDRYQEENWKPYPSLHTNSRLQRRRSRRSEG